MSLSNHGLRILLCCSMTLLSSRSFATVITDISLTLSNILITPTSGSVVFQDPLTAEVFVQVANSQGVLDQQFDSSAGGAAWVSASAQADAATMTLSTSSTMYLTGFNNQASFLSLSSLYGTFMITGGTGSVNVLLSMDVAGSLLGYTNSVGYFGQYWVATLSLDGTPYLFDFNFLAGGPNTPATVLTVNQSLSTTVSLLYNVPYFFYSESLIDAQPEDNYNVPEPTTLTLIVIGLGGFAARRWRPLTLSQIGIDQHPV